MVMNAFVNGAVSFCEKVEYFKNFSSPKTPRKLDFQIRQNNFSNFPFIDFFRSAFNKINEASKPPRKLPAFLSRFAIVCTENQKKKYKLGVRLSGTPAKVEEKRQFPRHSAKMPQFSVGFRLPARRSNDEDLEQTLFNRHFKQMCIHNLFTSGAENE